MSEPLSIALVAEGPTDGTVIRAAIRAALGGAKFRLTKLPPEESVAFHRAGAGWPGVYKWCKAAAARGSGRLANDNLTFAAHDLLVLHLDADVADKTYASANIVPTGADIALPCAKRCPPAVSTTNALRRVLLSWCGETQKPARTVICMPSKSTETWVVAALFPNDKEIKKKGECLADAEARLSQQPKKVRIRKCEQDYRANSAAIEHEWPRVCQFGEAKRFKQEFLAAVVAVML
jgi:hypothetical protein